MNDLNYNFRAPALPYAPANYDKQYIDQLNNVLRIYFNQLDNVLRGLVASSGPFGIYPAGTTADAFGRLRSSQPYTIFDSQNRYVQNDYFASSNSGTTQTYVANESTVNMATSNTTSGNLAVAQTKRSFSYQPGKSLLVMNTFVMGTAVAGVRMRVGYFNTDNGVFLERNSSAVRLVRRTFVSGAAVDTVVEQANWNGDKLNGTGDSGFTLNLATSQIFWQDFEWLGVGAVRCGFVINGQFITAHTFYNANNLATVYMTTAILPIRYELENVSTATSTATFKRICSTVISEGGYERKVLLNTAGRLTSAISITNVATFTHLVSIRLASGRTGAVVLPDGFSFLGSGTNAEFEVALLKNPTFSVAPTWTTATPSTNVQYGTGGTISANGTVVKNLYTSSGAQVSGAVAIEGDYNFDMQLGADLSGVSDVYSLGARTLASTHTGIGSLSFWDLT